MEERGPTKKQIRAWLDENPSAPTTVQPPYKQAQRKVTSMEKGFGYLNNGPVVSTIHQRCADCNKVIVERYNYMVPHDVRAETRYEMKYWHYGVCYAKPGTVCLGCFNKKRTEYYALKEWDETRRNINNVLHKVKKHKKEQLV